ncbi:MAG: PTS fructose transporter subunit IIA [Gammaproteobacteria bacterium]|nr:PTS fructose transporter subunit IIA [Gammaproteobacteria bacterium]
MPVGILIITHGEMGEELLATARSTLGGSLPLNCRALSVSPNCDPDSQHKKAEAMLASVNDGSGVLILTDMFGSTPSNIANGLKNLQDVEVIAGINLPMFIRILNYSSLSLSEMTEKALSGGHDGIILCEQKATNHD